MDLNFSTQQSFTRSFFREFKISPLAYRNELGFDCSQLFLGDNIDLHIKNPVKKSLPSLKLLAKEFQYRDALLAGSYFRGNSVRLRNVTELLSHKDEVFIVTALHPFSSLEFEVHLVAMIGYIDTINYNYETQRGDYWEFIYNGTWEKYILFGRFIFFLSRRKLICL
ncbi:hypothetical protein C4A55_02553 [Escherichia coli]|uniref:hypothetical protein n=1 Tax=Escherichia coli TaxID=562 RepID=UPI000E2CA65C|nr:hypothetical protein [Escherichia coli]EHS0425059.1 hypothetical protein [Escherichia coli]RDP45314.1 hypothetical protein C4A55_02553 [Escherichia coli]HBA9678001.1 hypothetical protein [Escherichia coli]HBB0203980.1 hypothetical protein [Escherichia coli]